MINLVQDINETFVKYFAGKWFIFHDLLYGQNIQVIKWLMYYDCWHIKDRITHKMPPNKKEKRKKKNNTFWLMYLILQSELLAPNWLCYIWLHDPFGKDYLSNLWKSGRWSGLHTIHYNALEELRLRALFPPSSWCGQSSYLRIATSSRVTALQVSSTCSTRSFWSDNSSRLEHDLTYHLCIHLKAS